MCISNANADFSDVTAYRDCRRRAAGIVVGDHDAEKECCKVSVCQQAIPLAGNYCSADGADISQKEDYIVAEHRYRQLLMYHSHGRTYAGGLPLPPVLSPQDRQAMRLGPNGSRKVRRRYVKKYRKLCESEKLRTSLSEIRTETALNMKLHAFLHLVQEHEDDIAGGMPITAEHFNTVLEFVHLSYGTVTVIARFKGLKINGGRGDIVLPFFARLQHHAGRRWQ